MSHSDTYVHWQAQFNAERGRLLQALGPMTAGGIVEQINHIGATSVPGLPTPGCLDIGLAVWPFPLTDDAVTAVQALGYQFVPGYENAPEQRFRQTGGPIQLHFARAGSDLALDPLIIRDYLRYVASARETYRQLKHSQAQRLAQLLDEARQWWISHHGFHPVQTVAEELVGYPHPWYISRSGSRAGAAVQKQKHRSARTAARPTRL